MLDIIGSSIISSKNFLGYGIGRSKAVIRQYAETNSEVMGDKLAFGGSGRGLRLKAVGEFEEPPLSICCSSTDGSTVCEGATFSIAVVILVVVGAGNIILMDWL
jgi:hypothetical protein